MNSYESPLSECDPPNSVEPPVRGGWLATASLILTLTTIIPNSDFLAIGLLKGTGFLYLLPSMAFCLAIPLVPLVIYLCLNGRRGLKAAQGRITIIGIFVGLIIAVDISFLLG